MNKISSTWFIVEFVFGGLLLAYFLGYPRDTLSDFIVCTIVSLLIYFWANKLGLYKPTVQNIGKADKILFLTSLSLFCFAWIYGGIYNKITFQTAFTSVGITLTYFYYAAIQHFLAQRYLALRMLTISESWNNSPKLYAAILTGFVFGALHMPYPNLIIPSTLGGFAYAYYFLSTGRLWAVIISHALISSTVLYWILDDNPFTELIVLFNK